MRSQRLVSAKPVLVYAGWAVVGWVLFAWRLGYPSFWDPDEAKYAETAREMLATHNWLVPTYDGTPFFDKPPLFTCCRSRAFLFSVPRSLPRASFPPFPRRPCSSSSRGSDGISSTVTSVATAR